MADGTKHCGKCKQWKPLTDFPVDKARHDGRHPWCKECTRSYHRARRAADPKAYSTYMARYRSRPEYEHQRRAGALAQYGITPEDYDALLEKQGGVCAICGGHQRRKIRRRYFAVDHDHLTGAVRGLLCDHCNSAIGLLGDDPARCRQAAEYLERSRQ